MEDFYKHTSLGTPIEDLTRFLEYVRNNDISIKEVHMPPDYYAKLTPEQVAWAEEEYGCKLIPMDSIEFRLRNTYLPQLQKDIMFKTSSPKEYGMSLIKRRKN